MAADPGAAELDAVLVLAPAPGWREPGTLLMPAFEGSTLAGWEDDCPGVAWWILNCGGLAAYGCWGACCWYASGVYCKGGALDGRRAWARRGVVYCCESGPGAELAIAKGVARSRDRGIVRQSVCCVLPCAGVCSPIHFGPTHTAADHVGVSGGRRLKFDGDISACLFASTTATTTARQLDTASDDKTLG